MRDWYKDWEQEKEDREEELHRLHMETLAIQRIERPEPTANNKGQYFLPLEDA